MKKLWWIFASVIVLLVLFSIYRFNTLNKDVNNKQEEKIYYLGDNIPINDVILTVNKVRTQELINDEMQPAQTEIAYFIDLTLKNTSNEIIDTNLMDYKLNSGLYYTMQDLTVFKFTNADNNLLNGQIKPNEVQSGELVFLMPEKKFAQYKDFNLVIPNNTYKGIKYNIIIPLQK
ncbi:DUF4352 domain-containing protein [Bacillus manliponensis]|uniref:DUF4352 domain-containing protein n=1 Tax=Bacillus manliponensis TaxID=574376 RepID=UPI003513F9FA